MIVKNILMEVQVSGAGMYEITAEVNDRIRPLEIESGMLNLFIQHTSASLMIQENADPVPRKIWKPGWIGWCPKMIYFTRIWLRERTICPHISKRC